MKAFVYEGNKALKLTEVSTSHAGEDTAVIKVGACSICGTDFRTYIHGSKRITPPRVIGHEVVGTIVEVGRGVLGFMEGDRVAVAPAIGCGHCHYCHQGYTNICDDLETIGFQYDGGFAEYMEIPARAFTSGNVNKLNNLIEDTEAAVAEPTACCINAQEFLNIKKDETIAIFGAGFIGSMHAELALRKGVARVVMIEVSEDRARQAAELLPDLVVLNPLQDDVQADINRLTAGKGAEVVITACSSGKAQESALEIAAKRGRISLFGGLPGESKGFIDSNLIHYKELGVYGVHASTPLQNQKALDMIATGKLDVQKYITTFPLENIMEAFAGIKEGRVLKAVIEP